MTAAGASARSDPAVRYRRILVALDASDASRHALAWAREIAKADRAEVVIASVVLPPYLEGQPFPGSGAWLDYTQTHLEELRAMEEIVDHAAADLRADGVQAKGAVVTGAAMRELVKLAAAERADLVVLGSHSRGPVGRLALGSVADGVRTHVDASILIARTAPLPERVLAASDGSPSSGAATAIAVRLASAWKATLAVTRVAPDDSVADRIAEHARTDGAGLVVIGTRGFGRLRGALQGSVSARLAHVCPVSLLIVKEASS